MFHFVGDVPELEPFISPTSFALSLSVLSRAIDYQWALVINILARSHIRHHSVQPNVQSATHELVLMKSFDRAQSLL